MTMTHKDFRRWRKALDLSQKDAAEALGLKRRVVQYYEKGERDGEPVDIPKAVRLACWALAQGKADYTGPDKDADKPAKAPKAAKPKDGKDKKVKAEEPGAETSAPAAPAVEEETSPSPAQTEAVQADAVQADPAPADPLPPVAPPPADSMPAAAEPAPVAAKPRAKATSRATAPAAP